jgi:hypothetical protein
MKNKFFGVASIIAIAVLATININFTKSGKYSNELLLTNVKTASADEAEWGGWDNFWQGQGFWKDEKEMSRKCPTSTSDTNGVSVPVEGGTITIGSTHEQTNPPDRYEIICGSGKDNCTSVPC